MIWHFSATKPMPVSNLHGRTFFFDTNVWCFLLSPHHANSQFNQCYNILLSDIISSKAKIMITPLLLSEYMNRRIRQNWKSYQDKVGKIDYKDYRKHSNADYGTALNTVFEEINAIRYLSAIIGDPTDSEYTKSIFYRVQTQNIDLNDSYIIELCEAHNYTLVTHDADCLITKADLFTAL